MNMFGIKYATTHNVTVKMEEIHTTYKSRKTMEWYRPIWRSGRRTAANTPPARCRGDSVLGSCQLPPALQESTSPPHH